MKVELCFFSQIKIHPGHGKRYSRADGKSYYFISKKAESLFLQRKNPRKIAWTIYYRRKMKKGIETETTKKKARKIVKLQRAVGDMTKEDMLKRRNEKGDFRKVQREQAIRAAKEAAKAKAKTKSKAPKSKAPRSKANVPKNQGRGKK
jgi:large subunit ribosomal protein L24e